MADDKNKKKRGTIEERMEMPEGSIVWLEGDEEIEAEKRFKTYMDKMIAEMADAKEITKAEDKPRKSTLAERMDGDENSIELITGEEDERLEREWRARHKDILEDK